MDWRRSYAATWRVFRVNRDTWADSERIEDVDSVSITRTADGSMLESGSMKLTGSFEPGYYRIVMTAEQGGEVARADVATMLFEAEGGSVNRRSIQQDVHGHSVLYPASVTTILSGEYAPAGVDGAAYAGDMLASAINAPVEVEGNFKVDEHIVHEIGSSVLEAVWAVLEAGGFVIQIDGRGVVHIRPRPTEPALILDSSNMRLLANGINYTTDLSEIPNRYVVVDDINRTVATNDSIESIVSTVSRGYNVDYVDTSPTPVNGETYSAYASRRLREMSCMRDERQYTREYSPEVFLYSIIRASINGLEGDLRVESQTVKCEHGITIDEKAVREVALWQ